MILKLVSAPNAVLSASAQRVNQIDKKIVVLVKNMEETLNSCTNPPGVGLAAPQVGYSLQIFLIKPKEKGAVKAFINPKIKEVITNSKNKDKHHHDIFEGCLSVNNTWAHINRSQSITVTYTDLSGIEKTETFSGYIAQIIQHEMDHLKGILFTQRALEQDEKLYEIKQEEGKEKFVEIEI